MSAQANPITIATPSPLSWHFQERFADLLARCMAAADLLGRLHALQVVKQKTGIEPRLNTLVRFAEMKPPSVLGFESVPFTGAIERIRNLLGMTRLAYDGLAQRYKMQAFTIAGVQDVRLIERLKEELANILQSGGTLADFRKMANALTSDAGVEQLSRTHLETVFQTNVQSAYQNGHFEQMRDPAVMNALPFWQYRTAGDNRVRPAHAALDGFTAAAEDPVWRRLYPPTGYNCRCTVIALLPSEAPEGSDTPGEPRIPAAAANVPDPGFGGGQ